MHESQPNRKPPRCPARHRQAVHAPAGAGRGGGGCGARLGLRAACRSMAPAKAACHSSACAHVSKGQLQHVTARLVALPGDGEAVHLHLVVLSSRHRLYAQGRKCWSRPRFARQQVWPSGCAPICGRGARCPPRACLPSQRLPHHEGAGVLVAQVVGGRLHLADGGVGADGPHLGGAVVCSSGEGRGQAYANTRTEEHGGSWAAIWGSGRERGDKEGGSPPSRGRSGLVATGCWLHSAPVSRR